MGVNGNGKGQDSPRYIAYGDPPPPTLLSPTLLIARTVVMPTVIMHVMIKTSNHVFFVMRWRMDRARALRGRSRNTLQRSSRASACSRDMLASPSHGLSVASKVWKVDDDCWFLMIREYVRSQYGIYGVCVCMVGCHRRVYQRGESARAVG